MASRTQILLAFYFLAHLASCGEKAGGSPPVVLWPEPEKGLPDEALSWSTVLAGNERLQQRNSWWQQVAFEKNVKIRHSRLPYFPVGNGSSFAFVATTNPLHTVHGATGPTYQIGGKGFFADVSFGVYDAASGSNVFFPKQAAWRVKSSGVVLTAAESSDAGIALLSLTFAPWTSEGGGPAMIIHAVEIANRGKIAASGLTLYSLSKGSFEERDGTISEERDGRVMSVVPLDREGWEIGKEQFMRGSGLVLKNLDIPPGESAVFSFAFLFAKADAPMPAAPSRRKAFEYLEDTIVSWDRWFSEGPSIETPDRRVDDLFESLQYTVKVQQAAGGAVVPMSHYSNVWIRDTFGPSRLFFRIGRAEDALAMIEYYHHAAAKRGDVGNALDCDIDVEVPVEEPDWLSLPPFEGRTRGEGPSHIPLMYAEYLASSGDRNLVIRRLPYLVRCLTGQGMTEDGLMYFSGDETFKPSMGRNLALGAEYKFEDLCHSANSAYLYVAASGFLRGFIESLEDEEARNLPFDKDEVLQLLRGREEKIAITITSRYWLEPEKLFSPFIYMDTMKPETRPSEDVNTMPLWLGVIDPADEKAGQNVETMYKLIGKPDGLVQTASGEDTDVFGYAIGNGIYTGMSAGYWLYNLKALEMAELGEKVFNMLPSIATGSGNFPEDGLYGTFEPLMVIYDESGGQGEIWAQTRPWEGAIMAEALLYYLTGIERHSADRSTASPSFPNRWRSFCVNDMPEAGRVCFEKPR